MGGGFPRVTPDELSMEFAFVDVHMAEHGNDLYAALEHVHLRPRCERFLDRQVSTNLARQFGIARA